MILLCLSVFLPLFQTLLCGWTTTLTIRIITQPVLCLQFVLSFILFLLKFIHPTRYYNNTRDIRMIKIQFKSQEMHSLTGRIQMDTYRPFYFECYNKNMNKIQWKPKGRAINSLKGDGENLHWKSKIWSTDFMGTNRFPEGVCGVHSRGQSDKQAQRGMVSKTITHSKSLGSICLYV